MTRLFVNKKTDLTSIFNTIDALVRSDCGDGDGAIFAENYKELANEFEKYQDVLQRVRYDRSDMVFNRFEESVLFCPIGTKVPAWTYCIVIEEGKAGM